MTLSFRGKASFIVAAAFCISAVLVIGSFRPSEPIQPSPSASRSAEEPRIFERVPSSPTEQSPGTVLLDAGTRSFGFEALSSGEPEHNRQLQASEAGPKVNNDNPHDTVSVENAGPIDSGVSLPGLAFPGRVQDGRRTTKLEPFREPIRPRPIEGRARKSRKSFVGDLRSLVSKPKKQRQRFQHEKVLPNPRAIAPPVGQAVAPYEAPPSGISPLATAPAPAPTITFEGLGRTGGWGNGYPADPTGDVGPHHYVQAINTALAVFDKSGNLLAGPMSLDTFMSQGNFGNLCDTDNSGDPVVLYDTFEDRWIVSNFAFTLSGQTVIDPPGTFQCIAVSRSGDPVAGGWNYYFINRTDALNDYPKLGIWPDGIYMSANMFDFSSGGFYHGVTVWALNKAQMYAGDPDVQVVSFDIGTGDFSLLPSTARLQTGTPPPGTPNFFVSTWNFVNALSVYKFSVDWNRISLSTFTGPDMPMASTSWPSSELSNAGVLTGAALDPVPIRAMMQNTYVNIGGAESLWLPHTVRRANSTGSAAPRWYQINVSGGTVGTNLIQASTWDPDGNNLIHRFMPSLSVDRAGNMAIGYTASGSSLHPSIRYAGRLFSDPVNTLSLTEQTMFAGTGGQTGTSRWGDYTHMTLDPDGCSFWYTNQYYAETGTVYRTRIGSFRFTECTNIGTGTLTGTITSAGSPVPGATVMLGSRNVTTGPDGVYLFNELPAGIYPEQVITKAGFGPVTHKSIAVIEGMSTVKDISLDGTAQSGCLPDTSQTDFQNGVPDDVELTQSGEIVLSSAPTLDQQNIDLIVGSGTSFTTAWHAQTFTPAATGLLKQVDVHLFSVDCASITMPALTVSIRAAAGNLPTGPDLATATIPGFCNGTSRFATGIFSAPVNVTAGTQYAIVWRTTLTGPSVDSNPRYVSTMSSSNPYSGGRRATSSNSGSSWTGGGSSNNDFGFRVFIDKGFAASGTYVSGLKDANPISGSTPVWGNITWSHSELPSGTNTRFQAAAADSPSGPFNFVGPDGTSATFFDNGGSLSQFDGHRYLRYKAVLTTTNAASTPRLDDVNLCFDNEAAAACAVVSIPDSLTMNGMPLSVPILVSEMSGLGARSADLTLTFDPNVITPTGNSANNWGVTLGTIGTSNGGGRTLTVSRPTSGSLKISVFGPTDFQGAGALVDLNFTVVGTPKSNTPISFASFLFNEGDPCAMITNGSVEVRSGSVSGRVTYGVAGTTPFPQPVPGVSVNAVGSLPVSTSTSGEGTYNLSGFGSGLYTVTPSKSGDLQGAISAFDAADIASHVVGGAQLINNQIIVADVSGNGTVTSFDAALVAAFVALLPDAGSTGQWRFLPANVVYPDVNADRVDQDYVALLMGDVTGSWMNPPPPNSIQTEAGPEAISISAPHLSATPGNPLTVPVAIGNTTGLGVRSFELELRYDANVLKPAATPAGIAGTISEGRVLTMNAYERGVLRIVVFGASPIEGQGELLNLHFDVIGASDSSTELRWENIRLNEGGVSFSSVNGLVSVEASDDRGSINGRLLDPSGAGLRGARVTITDTKGQSRSITTSTLGYFQMTGLLIGETYTVRAETRRYRFAPRVVNIASANAVDLTMIGLE